MIRTNLSTRPFYNERLVHAVLALAALVVVVFTAFNVTRVVQLSRSGTTLLGEAGTDEARAVELRADAAKLRAGVNTTELASASSDAQEANSLIDRRTFSWTELLNQFEATLPEDARITSVRPVADARRGNILTITVVARGVDDVDQFMEHLEATGAFKGLLSREERVNDDGQLEATLQAVYSPAPRTGAKP